MGNKHRVSFGPLAVLAIGLALALLLVACTGSPSNPAPPSPTSATSKAAEAPPKATEKSSTSTSSPSPAAKTGSNPAQASKTIKIGVISPLTGPMASLGASAKRGVDLAVEQINAAGGIKSIGGAKLELLHEDHQAKPDLAMGIAERLVQESNVSAIIGTTTSATNLTSTQAAERLKTPHLVSMSTADEITERGFKYTFRVSATNTGQAIFFVDLLKWLAQKGAKVQRVALLYEDTSMGQGLAEILKPLITGKDGFNLVTEVSYPAQGRDFSAQVARLKAASPDIVLDASYPGDAILLRKTIDQMGFDPLIAGQESGVGHPDYLKAVGPLAEGEIISTMSNVDLDVKGMPAYVKAYQAKYGQPPDNNATFPYQSVYLLAEALEKSGSDDREAIRKALSELSLGQGPSLVLPVDPFRFDEKGQSNVGYIALQVQKGNLVTVWPEKFKAGDLVLK